MARIDGSALMFDDEAVRSTTKFLPRLVRIIFYGSKITNDEYLKRYMTFLRGKDSIKTKKDNNHKISSDRKFLSDPDNVTFKLMHHAMTAMGLDIECVSVRVRDRITGESRTFSTDDTADELKKEFEKEELMGIQSII